MITRIKRGWELQKKFSAFDRDYYTPDAYDFMLNYYDEFDENMEVDVIAMCCEWTEYSLEELIDEYRHEFIEWLEENVEEYEEISQNAVEESEFEIEYLEDFAEYLCNSSTLPYDTYKLEDGNFLIYES